MSDIDCDCDCDGCCDNCDCDGCCDDCCTCCDGGGCQGSGYGCLLCCAYCAEDVALEAAVNGSTTTDSYHDHRRRRPLLKDRRLPPQQGPVAQYHVHTPQGCNDYVAPPDTVITAQPQSEDDSRTPGEAAENPGQPVITEPPPSYGEATRNDSALTANNAGTEQTEQSQAGNSDNNSHSDIKFSAI